MGKLNCNCRFQIAMSFRMLVLVVLALVAAACADMKASHKLVQLDLDQDQNTVALDENVADLEDGKMEIPKKVPKLLDLVKWDGKVLGAHTYSVTWIDLVKYFTDKSFDAAKTTDTFKEKLGDGNVHVIGWCFAVLVRGLIHFNVAQVEDALFHSILERRP